MLAVKLHCLLIMEFVCLCIFSCVCEHVQNVIVIYSLILVYDGLKKSNLYV